MFQHLHNLPEDLVDPVALARHDSEIYNDGYTIIQSFLHPGFVDNLKNMVFACKDEIDKVKVKKGLKLDGGYHHLPAAEYRVLEQSIACLMFKPDLYQFRTVRLLKSLEAIDSVFRNFFGSSYILNSIGGVINRTDLAEDYLHNWHKDIRTVPGNMRYMINVLVMLTDFTEDNGATYLIPRSHQIDNFTEADEYLDRSVRLTGKAGDIVLFNSACWHKAGYNNTSDDRVGITITLSRNFMKPQYDYCEFFRSIERNLTDEFLAQLLGYNHRVPVSLEEWYSEPDQRTYKGD